LIDLSQGRRSQGRRSQSLSHRSRLQKLTKLSNYWLVVDVIHNPASVVVRLPWLFIAWLFVASRLFEAFIALRSKTEIIIISLTLHRSEISIFQ
jgi:hypothetical protein